MKVTPDDLSKGIEVLALMPRGSEKELYWNGVHRLESEAGGTSLVLKTTSGDAWIEWHMPVKDNRLSFRVNVKREQFAAIRGLLGGGSFTISLDNAAKTLGFKKARLHVPLHFETPMAPYPESGEADAAPTWRFRTETLVNVLHFAYRFIDIKGHKEKTCATLYPNGTLVTGSPTKIVIIEGVSPEAPADPAINYISLTAPQARLVAAFLPNLGPIVELLASGDPTQAYAFRDPATGNKLVLTATEAQFMLEPTTFQRTWRESSHVDRKILLTRAKAFGMVVGLARNPMLALTFRGDQEHSSLEVSTTEDESRHRCSDEFQILRDAEAGSANSATTVPVGAIHLLQALSSMEATQVVLSYDGRLLKISETLPKEEKATNTDQRHAVVRSVILSARDLAATTDTTRSAEGGEPGEPRRTEDEEVVRSQQTQPEETSVVKTAALESKMGAEQANRGLDRPAEAEESQPATAKMTQDQKDALTMMLRELCFDGGVPVEEIQKMLLAFEEKPVLE